MSFFEYSTTIVKELSEVMQRVSSREIVDLRKEVLAARRIVIIGVGREGLAARAFTMRLRHLNFDSHWVWDDTTPPVGPGDLVIATSGSGEIGHIDYVLGRARAHGARTVVATANPAGKSAREADLVLNIPAAAYLSDGDMVSSIQPMGSLFEQALWITFDCLILELEAAIGFEHADMAKNHRNVE